MPLVEVPSAPPTTAVENSSAEYTMGGRLDGLGVELGVVLGVGVLEALGVVLGVGVLDGVLDGVRPADAVVEGVMDALGVCVAVVEAV